MLEPCPTGLRGLSRTANFPKMPVAPTDPAPLRRLYRIPHDLRTRTHSARFRSGVSYGVESGEGPRLRFEGDSRSSWEIRGKIKRASLLVPFTIYTHDTFHLDQQTVPDTSHGRRRTQDGRLTQREERLQERRRHCDPRPREAIDPYQAKGKQLCHINDTLY